MKFFLLLLSISAVVISSSQCGIRLSKESSTSEESQETRASRTANRVARAIIGGTNVTSPGKWPWQVMVVSSPTGEPEDIQVCGGTIISEQWVLTAAHCVAKNDTGTAKHAVLAGFSSLDEFDKENGSNVTESFIHSGYDADYKTNDIALLKLDTPLPFNDVIAPICLPSPTQSIPNDGRAVITGFGDTQVEGSSNETRDSGGQLREAIVPIVSPEVCEERWSHAVPLQQALSIMIWRMRKVVCASSLAHGTHKGDSGGPLMMKAADARWFQIGVTAFGHINENYAGIRGDIFPKAFTDVRKYCDWIKETTGGEVKCQEEEVTLEDVEIKA